LKEALDPVSGLELAIPDDPELVEELLAVTYKEADSGTAKIRIIAKEDLHKLLGRSPDKADALAICFWAAGRPEKQEESAREYATLGARGAGGREKARWNMRQDELPYRRR
jgi:hypothetical protein